MRWIVSSLLLLSLFSCREEIEPVVSDKAFDGYLERFIEEGQKRGYPLDLDETDIIFKFGNLPSLQTGICRPRKRPRHIYINPKYWEVASGWEREAIIFHELGHCVLGRIHLNEKLPNGECASLMDGKEDGFSCVNNLVCPRWRDYYYDELFDPETPLPHWYPLPEKPRSIAELPTSPLYYFPEEGIAHVSNFKLNTQKDFLLSAVYSGFPAGQEKFGIWWNDLYFSYHVDTSLVKIQQYTSQPQLSYAFYQKELKSPPGELRLSLQGDQDNLHFWLNDQLLHTISKAYIKDSTYWEWIKGQHLSIAYRPEVQCQVELYVEEAR